VKAVMALRTFSLAEHPSSVKLVEVLQLGVSVCNPRHCHCWGHDSLCR